MEKGRRWICPIPACSRALRWKKEYERSPTESVWAAPKELWLAMIT
jgi:hypothetical protein